MCYTISVDRQVAGYPTGLHRKNLSVSSLETYPSFQYPISLHLFSENRSQWSDTGSFAVCIMDSNMVLIFSMLENSSAVMYNIIIGNLE